MGSAMYSGRTWRTSTAPRQTMMIVFPAESTRSASIWSSRVSSARGSATEREAGIPTVMYTATAKTYAAGGTSQHGRGKEEGADAPREDPSKKMALSSHRLSCAQRPRAPTPITACIRAWKAGVRITAVRASDESREMGVTRITRGTGGEDAQDGPRSAGERVAVVKKTRTYFDGGRGLVERRVELEAIAQDVLAERREEDAVVDVQADEQHA